MKKISILGIALLAAGSMSAQTQLVKDVKNQLKDVKAYPQAIENLKPAFTNPETEKDAETWFVAGKGAMDYVNNAVAMSKVTGNLNGPQAAQYVMDGFDYLETALPLTQIPDAKGKVNNKLAKEVVKQVVNNYQLAADAGTWFYNDAHDYPNAAKAWSYLFTLPQNPEFVKGGLKAYPDSVLGQYMFYTACAYSLDGKPEPALEAFQKSIALGYDKKEAYDYAITSATQMKDLEKAAEIARKAYEVYPDNAYLGTMINNFLDKKEYTKAEELLAPYAAKDPDNAQVYFLQGVIADQQNKLADAKVLYKRAIALDANHANALFRYAYTLCQEADQLDQEEGGNVSQAEYKKFCEEKTFPLYREAAENLEKAYSINENLTDCLTLLRNIYYKLGDEANYERVKYM